MMINTQVDNDLTEKIIGAFFTVYNKLGFGYLEKVYENALKIELKKNGLSVDVQRPIKVFYDGIIVGEYFADLFVEDKVLIELKTTSNITVKHESQLFHYLKATNTEIGLLFNFGPTASFKRKLWTPSYQYPCESVKSGESV